MICASFNVSHAQIVTNLAWRSKLGLFHIAHPCSPFCLRFKLLYQSNDSQKTEIKGKVPLFVSFSENLSTKGFFVRLCVEDYT